MRLGHLEPPVRGVDQVRELAADFAPEAVAAVTGVDAERIRRIARELAAAGADFLSIGALTHSAPAADLSLDLTPCRSRTPHRSPRAR